MSNTFKVGDRVQSKGIAGPVMLVSAVMNNGIVHCFWFSGKKKEASQFHPDTLEIAPEPGQAG